MIDINLETMFSLFTGWLNKNENDSQLEGHSRYDLSEPKNIMSFNKGKLFKGHDGGLVVEGTKLRLVNCYYTNVVVQIYDTEKDIVTTEYIVVDPTNPKYIQKIVSNTKTINSNINYLIPVSDNIDIELTEWSLRIIKTTEEKGLAFKNHWDNINELRTLRQYLSKFKKFLKSNSEILLTAKKHSTPKSNLPGKWHDDQLIIKGVRL